MTRDSTNWRQHAACLGTPAEMFFPEKGGGSGQLVADAKAYCRACPVIEACLDHALRNHERHGVWGGLTEAERRDLRRRLRRQGNPVPTRPHWRQAS